MINKDYILRMAEKFGRALAIILHLREYNKYEEALLYVDDQLLQATGLTSSFINSVSDEMLIQAISPLGVLSVEKCLWIAVLLKAEGEIYEEQAKTNESYYRYIRSLRLYLLLLPHEASLQDSNLANAIEIQEKLFSYYENVGKYDKAEDVLFDVLDTHSTNGEMIERGRAFYTRLQARSDVELLMGNLSRTEVAEGSAQLEAKQH